MIAGVIVVVLGILFQLFVLLLGLAIPIGLALLVAGGIWLLVERARAKR
jgi:hypothetical protein